MNSKTTNNPSQEFFPFSEEEEALQPAATPSTETTGTHPSSPERTLALSSTGTSEPSTSHTTDLNAALSEAPQPPLDAANEGTHSAASEASAVPPQAREKEDGRKSIPLFSTFFHIGLFTIGGGYAMIPLIEQKIVEENKWITREELLDLMAVAQSCPGIFAVNIATFIGYKLRGVSGALMAACGCILPSFLIILAIALFFRQFQDNPWVARAFRGIRPCVVALIAAPTFKMAKSAKIGWTNVWIPVFGAFLIWMFGVSPIWVIAAAGLGGYLYGKFIAAPAQEQ